MSRTFLSLAAAALLYAAPATAQDVRVPIGDLDLSTGVGAQTFDARVAAAARPVCGIGPRAILNANCLRRVRQEALRSLSDAARQDYVRARRGDRILAQVAPAWAG